MKKSALILVACAFLIACGGRASHPVEATTAFDDQLTCDHLRAEMDVNTKHIADLMDEKDHSENNNLGAGLLMPLYMIDLSHSERTEIEALQKRNETLTDLMKRKNC